MKGRSRGDAQVSPIHANWIINRGTASAMDVAWLMKQGQTEVLARAGIQLHLEVLLVGEWDPAVVDALVEAPTACPTTGNSGLPPLPPLPTREGGFTAAIPEATEVGRRLEVVRRQELIQAVRDALDRMLDTYGTFGAYDRDRHASHRYVSEEIGRIHALPQIEAGHVDVEHQIALERRVVQPERHPHHRALGRKVHALDLDGPLHPGWAERSG